MPYLTPRCQSKTARMRAMVRTRVRRPRPKTILRPKHSLGRRLKRLCSANISGPGICSNSDNFPTALGSPSTMSHRSGIAPRWLQGGGDHAYGWNRTLSHQESVSRGQEEGRWVGGTETALVLPADEDDRSTSSHVERKQGTRILFLNSGSWRRKRIRASCLRRS